jgi:lysophospholipase L1-like esterase
MGQPPAPAGAPGNGRYFPPVPRDAKLPTFWIIGDSTVRNGTLGDGTNMGQWGWGATLPYYFDLQKINVVNRAFGGTSSRSFYDGFFWKNLQPQIKKGDFVIMQFGANDSSAQSIPGVGDDTRDANGTTIHSFGWYLTQFVKETRAQGATPIIASLTPRKKWNADGTRLVGDQTTHAGWAAQVAKDTGTLFVDLNELICIKYGQLGKAKVDTLYVPTPTEGLHTGWDGAVVNAECVISGLKALKDDPLADYFSARSKAVPAVEVSQPATPAAK